MDNMTFRREKDFRLGEMARAILQDHDLFAVLADPLAFAGRTFRFPSGPAILLPDMPLVSRCGEDDLECERWDGLS